MTNPYAFTELFRNSFDLNQFFATQRRNIEALSAANQALVEGAQAVSRRQAEAARESMEGWLRASREMFTAGTPEANISRQTELTKQVVESTLNNIREVTEMVTKSSFEAFDVINKRCSESLEELSRASGSASASRKKAA